LNQASVSHLKKRYRDALSKKIAHIKRLGDFFYDPNLKQLEFHHAGVTAKERLFLAGNRCGKTFAGAAEVGFHLTGLYPDWWQGFRFPGPINAWVASVSVEATRDILQPLYVGERGVIPMSRVLQISYRRGVSQAVDSLRVRHVTGGISILGFKSYDQGRESFQGTSRHVIHLDEEPPLNVYLECLLRTLDVGGMTLLTMTPLQGMTRLCQRFLGDSPPAESAVVRASWADARHLKPADVSRLQQSLPEHERAAREYGIPSFGRGQVFPVAEESIRCQRFEIPPEWPRVFGMDFGWSNPTAAVWIATDPQSGVRYLYDTYLQCEQTPAFHAMTLKERGSDLVGVCDPSGQSANAMDGSNLMEIYAREGVALVKAENAVESGLMQVLDLLKSGKLKIFNDLGDWWREFRLYRRDGNGRIVKTDDHLMDATRYAVVSGVFYARNLAPRRPVYRTRPDAWTLS
jgi:phage terminase large subunit-like protein